MVWNKIIVHLNFERICMEQPFSHDFTSDRMFPLPSPLSTRFLPASHCRHQLVPPQTCIKVPFRDWPVAATGLADPDVSGFIFLLLFLLHDISWLCPDIFCRIFCRHDVQPVLHLSNACSTRSKLSNIELFPTSNFHAKFPSKSKRNLTLGCQPTFPLSPNLPHPPHNPKPSAMGQCICRRFEHRCHFSVVSKDERWSEE